MEARERDAAVFRRERLKAGSALIGTVEMHRVLRIRGDDRQSPVGIARPLGLFDSR
jgi:hypothetical protein